MMILGFFTACVYILIGLYTSKGDWLKFFLGHQKENIIKGEMAKRNPPTDAVDKNESRKNDLHD